MESAGVARMPWIFAVLLVLSLFCIPAVKGSPETASSGRRSLLGFRETLGNASFQCSPSGPCIPCQYSEKKDEKYRCSETGYRLPFKCVETQDGSKKESKSKKQRKLLFQASNMAGSVMQKQLISTISNYKFRKLMDDSSESESEKQNYVTYRSCVPGDGEEKLSVLGFELIMVGMLLISGPIVYFRQKRPAMTLGTGGASRIPSNSPRF